MEEKYLIEPDTKFIREVIGQGGESLKKCFQCSTCTVVCSLSPKERPFPRKEMIWAQWGLKDRLFSDPDIWLCHQCTDCSTRCPRGAKPGNVLAAIRSSAISHFTPPGFLARTFQAPKYLPAILLTFALLLFAFLWAFGDLAFPEGAIVFHRMIPLVDAYIGMAAITIFVLTVVTIGATRFWKNMTEFETNPELASSTRGSFIKSSISSVVKILRHSNFDKCEANKISRYSHLAIFYGAILLLLATFLSAVFHHFAGIDSPHPLTSPVKIAGNLGAILLLSGCLMVIYRRLFNSNDLSKTTYSDWLLILLLLFVTISGIATEVIRLFKLAEAAYWAYLVHLWLMFTLLVYGPFSKGAHLIYRTLAMTYAKQIGREVE